MCNMRLSGEVFMFTHQCVMNAIEHPDIVGYAIARDSKSDGGLTSPHGFESHPLRQISGNHYAATSRRPLPALPESDAYWQRAW